MRLNIHIYPSQFKFESRILKITESLVENDIADEVIIIALPGESLPEWQTIDERRKVWRPSFFNFGLKKGLLYKTLFLIQYVFKITYLAINKEIAIVNSHSITDFPVAWWMSFLNKAILIYDTHELETERNGLKPFSKKVYKIVEKVLIRKAHHIFVVSDNIKLWYQKEYNLKDKEITVVKNVPKPFLALRSEEKFETLLKIEPGAIKFLYQGGLFYGRGIPLLLKAFSLSSPDKHLIIMGYGHYAKDAMEYAEKYANIHYVPAVPPEEVLSYTCSADVGIALIENICLSYYYCMPNKLYEYYMAGIPSLVSDFPDMSGFVKEAECGWTIDVEPDPLEKFINKLTIDEVGKKKEFLKQNRNAISWVNEEIKLIIPYKKLINS